MAVTNCYKVNWHWEVGGKKVNHDQVDYVQAAANDYNTIRNVLVSNQGKSHGGATFVVDSVLNVGITGISQ